MHQLDAWLRQTITVTFAFFRVYLSTCLPVYLFFCSTHKPTMFSFRYTLSLFAILCLLAACMPVGNTTRETTPQLTVFAAASLSEAFGEIGVAFEAKHPGTKVAFNFAGSQQLLQQLAQGAKADIFAAANQAQMDKAIAEQLVDSANARIFAENRMVIVVPKQNLAAIHSLADLATPGHKLVLAAKEVPAGAYALQVLEKAGASATFGSDFATSVLGNVVSYEENVRAVLTKVILSEADAGIVYQSDISATTEVAAIEIPEAFNIAASYWVAPLKASAHSTQAQQFVDFLFSEEAQTILTRYGFTKVA